MVKAHVSLINLCLKYSRRLCCKHRYAMLGKGMTYTQLMKSIPNLYYLNKYYYIEKVSLVWTLCMSVLSNLIG